MTPARPSEANLLILDAIARSLPRVPTLRELMTEFGYTSPNAVREHLVRLRRHGLVEWGCEGEVRCRTLRLTFAGRSLADERLLLLAVTNHHAVHGGWPRASTLEAHPDADAIGRALARMVRAGSAG